jgi:UDP-N-acetylmuramate: L-alanyl-gamma-D-glutamyl-meso-diaminopimelate ligase
LRRKAGTARILAVLEPRSNTMKLGVHKDQLASSLKAADQSWFFTPPDLGWDMKEQVSALGARARFADKVEDLARSVAAEARPDDHILIMSNGGFGGLHDKLLQLLKQKGAA